MTDRPDATESRAAPDDGRGTAAPNDIFTRLARPVSELTADERQERDYVLDALMALASMDMEPETGETFTRELVRRTRNMRAARERMEAYFASRGETPPDDDLEGDDDDEYDDAHPPDPPWSDEQVAAVAGRIRARVAACDMPVARWEWDEGVAHESPALPMGTAVERAARAGCAPWHDLSVAAGAGRELWDAPCERWLALPPGLPPARQARYVALTVAGDSMAPLLHAGDVVLVRLTRRLARDAVAVVRRPDDGYVVKQVGALRARAVELHSLNPAYPPVEIPRDEGLVVGTVVGRWSRHRDRLEAGD